MIPTRLELSSGISGDLLELSYSGGHYRIQTCWKKENYFGLDFFKAAVTVFYEKNGVEIC